MSLPSPTSPLFRDTKRFMQRRGLKSGIWLRGQCLFNEFFDPVMSILKNRCLYFIEGGIKSTAIYIVFWLYKECRTGVTRLHYRVC